MSSWQPQAEKLLALGGVRAGELVVKRDGTATAVKPAWIVSFYVNSQMPPKELDAYFDNLGILMQRSGRAALQMRLSLRAPRTGWYHNRSKLAQRLARRGLKVVLMRTGKLMSKTYRVRGIDARLIVGRKDRRPGVKAWCGPTSTALLKLAIE